MNLDSRIRRMCEYVSRCKMHFWCFICCEFLSPYRPLHQTDIGRAQQDQGFEILPLACIRPDPIEFGSAWLGDGIRAAQTTSL